MPESISLSVSEPVGVSEEATLAPILKPEQTLSVQIVKALGGPPVIGREDVQAFEPFVTERVILWRPICGLCHTQTEWAWDGRTPWRCPACGGSGSLYLILQLLGEIEPQARWVWVTWDARWPLLEITQGDGAYVYCTFPIEPPPQIA